ncbi:phosphoesterase PA-phosphatase related protein [Oscillatoria nigro-viridis PCC 7112]|uniref:Phosphoesterase PA-phosphatase related protein n=1 Tax=Phormidium nigroviride PCC 7112 TaxID=179408 RepID=K9VLD4_9CYAN|nr:phosphatase PAP2 family protein [Oscillatoria nigro-viridis]AFZ08307.1 phosphoesterase PA-phosphatase related protein [Oscillatoria nigro-viridis PCC 7112]
MLSKSYQFWLRHINPHITTLIVTIGVVGIASCLSIIFLLAWLFEEVLEKQAFGFDTAWIYWVHGYATPNLDAVMLTITQLADARVVVVIVALTLGILWWRNHRSEAKIFAIACLGAFILNNGMKLFFAKPRPHIFPSLISETSFSFPSGHALGGFVMYGFLAYLLSSRFPKYSKFIYTLAVITIAAIGLSRIYIGVHWPTDIIAGYGVGYIWLMLCITMLKLQTRQV